MARETIASVKRVLNAALRTQAKGHEAAIESLVKSHACAERELRQDKDRQASTIVSMRSQHASEIVTKDARIDELFKSNNDYLAEARSARAETARVQVALSDASRVIAALGQRPE
jgi:hypothetical protein